MRIISNLRNASALVVARARALVAEHQNTIVFGAGFGWLYAGVAGFSRPAANMTAGLILIAIAVWPYWRLSRQRKG